MYCALREGQMGNKYRRDLMMQQRGLIVPKIYSSYHVGQMLQQQSWSNIRRRKKAFPWVGGTPDSCTERRRRSHLRRRLPCSR